MERQIVAICIQEAGRLISGLLSLRTPKLKPQAESLTLAEPQEVSSEETTEEKTEKGTACLPCTNSHLHTCVGLLSEAVRMSPDGLNTESMKRVDKCLYEIAAAERVDLAPENVDSLPQAERVIADHASKELRDIRHGLEGLSTKSDLEQLTIQTTTLQKYVGKEWFKIRLAKMPREEKVRLAEKTIENLEKEVRNG